MQRDSHYLDINEEKYIRCVQSPPLHPFVQTHEFGAVHVPPFSHVELQIAEKNDI